MRQMQSAPGPRTIIDGKEYDYFCGTGYLCLQSDPRVIKAGCDALMEFGTGTATSRSGYGTGQPLIELEKQAAEFYGTEKAFCFSSGYSGPSVLISALQNQFDILFMDEASHFCAHEAYILSHLKGEKFRHRNPEHLNQLLEKHCSAAERPLVLTDGIFPVSGAVAPLDEYRELIKNSDGALIVDDAHALGVLGKRGRGTAEHLGIEGKDIYTTATLSKAIGGYGGVIPCSDELSSSIRKNCGQFDGASPPSHAAAATSAKGLEIAMKEPDRRQRLQCNAHNLKIGLRKLGIDIEDSPVPIASIEGKGRKYLRGVQQRLSDRGILIAYIERYSGVSESGALRIAVFSEHTQAMIDNLLYELEHAL